MVVYCKKRGGRWSGWKCKKCCLALGEPFTSHRERLTFRLHSSIDGEVTKQSKLVSVRVSSGVNESVEGKEGRPRSQRWKIPRTRD
jgi:hypothetical protein